MAYERRRVSTESDKSSTSTTHSIESNATYSTMASSIAHPSIPVDQKPSLTSNKKASQQLKRASTMSSPAEQILARTKNSFVDLNPYFQCSSLPSHWRKNKSLRFILRTKPQVDVETNTRVLLLAGNDSNPCATLKNNVSWFRDGQAEFNDLRFLGASGRGKKFTLTIIIQTTPPQQCTYRRAIKITVDGPRKKRELKIKSDGNDMQADDSNMDGESDDDMDTKVNPMPADSQPTIGQGSSGLLLLAAAAEQKRKDEEDGPHCRPIQSAPMKIAYPSKMSDTSSPLSTCLSPSSSLAAQFHQAVAFSPTSSFDDFHSRSSRSALPAQSASVTTTTVPLVSHSPTTNLILSLTSTPNRFEIFHQQQQRRDPSTIIDTSTAASSTNAKSAHVLCR